MEFDELVLLASRLKEPVLILTVKEAIIITDCPFSNTCATDSNYPGYNDVIRKIRQFAKAHRND